MRDDAERMDFSRNQCREERIDLTMTLYRGEIGEFSGNDRERKMPAAPCCAGMSRVPMALVKDFDVLGVKRRKQVANGVRGRHSGFPSSFM